MTAATPTQIAGYKAEAHRIIQDDGSVRYYRSVTDRDDTFAGMRLTDCCAAYSTYMDDGCNGTELCCKYCANIVNPGEGDGVEFRS